VEANYIVWQAEGEPLRIEFSRLALEQVRRTCYGATNGVLRGGRGVGGLLYGTRLGSLWRVLGWRAIPCSYPRGEPFSLSGGDEVELERMLGDEPPPGMMLVGWFASHPRGGLLLSPEERRIHSVFFSATERLMITMRATRSGDLAMAIHVPSPSQPPVLFAMKPELTVAPMGKAEFETAAKERAEREEAGKVYLSPVAAPGPVRTTYFAVGFAGALVAVAALAVLGWQLTQTGILSPPERLAARISAPPRLLSMHIAHDGAQLEVDWDPRAYSGSEPRFASVICIGASMERSIELNPEALREGHLSIPLEQRPSSVILSVRTSSGKSLRETARLAEAQKK